MKDWKKLLPDKTVLVPVHYTKGRSGHKVVGVGVHYNAGDLTTEDCKRIWLTRPASAHYQVEDDGLIGQLVYDSNTAWALGDWDANCKTISIEHANEPNGTITEKCLDNGAHLVAAICHHYGLGRPEWLKNVYPHEYFQATSCPGQIYGSQKTAYIKRCQYWYDKMSGKDVEKPSSSTSKPSASKPSASGLPSGAKDFKQDPLLYDGYFGPLTVKQVQWCLRVNGYYPSSKYVVDGSFGHYTKLGLQRYLAKRGYYTKAHMKKLGYANIACVQDGDFGFYSVLALQSYLKARKTYWKKGYGWCDLDGSWGELTTIALQRAINGNLL